MKPVFKGGGTDEDVALVLWDRQLSHDREPLRGESPVDVEKLPIHHIVGERAKALLQ